MNKKALVLFASTLVCASLTCSVFEPTPDPDINQVATFVAATLSAQGVELPPTNPPATSSPPMIPTSPAATLPVPSSVQRIVYTDNGNLWHATGPNPPQQITNSGNAVQVVVSSDGMKTAFITYDMVSQTYELRSVDIDGSNETVLLSQTQFDALYPLGTALHNGPFQLEFIPDTYLLLMNTQAFFEGPGLAEYEDLLQVDAVGGFVTTILAPGQGGQFEISPDGTQVVLVRPTSVSFANIDGSNLRSDVVTFSQIITYSEFLYHPPPVWGPNSASVGIVIPSDDPLAPNPSGTVWHIPTEGGAPVSLATIAGSFYFPQMGGGSLISPDLTKIAYLREIGPNTYELYHANADGSNETLYETAEISWIGWAPDSSHFVYAIGSTNLQLGRIGYPPLPFASGINLRWINETRYVFLSGSYGAWTLIRGQLGAGNTPIVSPIGEFVTFDIN
jgi:hypothetical protein